MACLRLSPLVETQQCSASVEKQDAHVPRKHSELRIPSPVYYILTITHNARSSVAKLGSKPTHQAMTGTGRSGLTFCDPTEDQRLTWFSTLREFILDHQGTSPMWPMQRCSSNKVGSKNHKLKLSRKLEQIQLIQPQLLVVVTNRSKVE